MSHTGTLDTRMCLVPEAEVTDRQKWVPGTELGSSQRAIFALSHRAVSSTPICISLICKIIALSTKLGFAEIHRGLAG